MLVTGLARKATPEAWALLHALSVAAASDGFLLVFEYPGQEPHAVIVLVDWNTGGVLERAALSDEPEGTLSK